MMAKLEDIEVRRGRAEGGDFLLVTHRPSGISRRRGPPLVSVEMARSEMMMEIEAELSERGIHPPKSSS